MSRKVLVVAETRDGRIRNVTFEALSAARTIARGGEIAVALPGSREPGNLSALAELGAAKICFLQDERLDQYAPDAYLQALTGLIRDLNPDAVLTGHTAVGRDLMPRLAARFGAGLISDATAVESAGDEVIFTRPIHAGKAFQKKRFRFGMIFATIRPNNIPPAEAQAGREAVRIVHRPDIGDIRTLVRDVVRKESGGVDLTEARIIVSGGRGVGSAEGFKVLRELAEVLGGAVGASRGACDAGYADYSMQIGQTGKVVTPDLYIACGISGAVQHLAGMSNSKVIVAVNKDPEAPIFGVADYGIVGDLFEVVPVLTEEFRKLLSEAAV